MVNGIHFDLTAKIQTSNGTASFEHGEFYPAIIAGLWVGKTEWQGKMSDGFAPLFIVKDEDGKCVARAGKFIKCYAGYNIYNGKTAFAKLMQGMLGNTLDGADLQRAAIEAGYDDISKLIGKPCSVRMAIKKTDRGTYAYIDDVSRPSSRRPGLDDNDLTEVDVDPVKVFGKFVQIPDPTCAAYIKAVRLTVPVNQEAMDENLF